MKVHLIVAPTNFPLNQGDLGKGTDPPLGILYLASYVRKYGPEVEFVITDGLVEDFQGTIESIKKEKADVIGISAVTTNILAAYKLTGIIRGELPEAKIVFGGPHPTAMPEEAFEKAAPNIVVVGEGEVTFTQLLQCCANGEFTAAKLKEIDGICFKDGDELVQTKTRAFIKDLDTVPFPARDLIDMEKYKGYVLSRATPSTALMSTRGCPFACTFCSNNVWKCSKPAYRVRSAKNVADEIEALSKLGYKEFFDVSDEFNAKLDHTKSILKEIISRNLDIHIKCQLRAKPIDEELVLLMKQAGIWYIHLGIESGNPETLKGIRKNVTHEEVEKCCRLLKKHDIKIWGLFMYFNIWETDGKLIVENYEQSHNTFLYAKKLYKQKQIDYFGGSICTPLPGSELWDITKRHNLIKKEVEGDWDKWYYKRELRLVSIFPGVDEKDIFKLHQKTFRYIALSLIKGNVINLKNLGFTLLRGMYFLKRQFMMVMNKVLRKK